MSNATEEIIDVKKSRVPWKGIGILCSGFAAAVILCTVNYSFYRFITINQQLMDLVVDSQNKIQLLLDDFAEVQANANTASQAVLELSAETKSLTKKVEEISQLQGGDKSQWPLAEARYYVKLAQVNLQAGQNVPLAISLLKMADREISQLPGTKWEAIRKALAADLLDLQSVPIVDVTGLYLQLAALDTKIDHLPLVNKPSLAPTQKRENNIDQSTWWGRGLHTTWEELRKLVVVRYNTSGKLPLITVESQTALYQNLHAEILQAMWALLHGETAIYRVSLQQAATWISEYFVSSSPITQTVLNNITELQKIDIHPPIPKISNSLQAFEEIQAPLPA